MRANLIDQTPRTWLQGQGLTAEEIHDTLATFGPERRVDVLRFHRGESFYRFHGRHAKRPIFGVNFWVHGSVFSRALGHSAQFEGWLSDTEIARVAKQYYRDIAAISHVWDRKDGTQILGEMHGHEFWKIELRDDEYVDGLLGSIAPQPTHQASLGQGASRSILQGGGLQAVLRPQSPFLCTPLNWG